ncbi:hypothetical protein BGZ97_006280 [Linnemannia gamsii]|uniref:Galactose oxidase n=1 Tax=Linnemannia gamsii TaxID=64522 RepID=A0A9P6RE97_9FUNG|nr:hypothetical protein BGZ97_006280 [Linnemannia gamsii]
MTIYTISTGATTSSFIPTTLVGVQISYSFTWCQPRKAFMLFTGDITTVNPFFEYIPSSGQWTNVASTSSGAIPTFKLRSCMVSAYNGTKMLLFGGDTGSASVATLSILDVKTMAWSKAKDAPDTRSDMACSVSGDNFIVWGGYKRNIADVIIGVPTTPLIYNLASGEWTTKYVRSNRYNPTGPGELSDVTSNGEKTGGGGSKSNAVAIGGGVAGGLAVIAVVAFLTIRRRRQKLGQDYNDTKHTEAISQYNTAPPSMDHTNPQSHIQLLQSELAQSQKQLAIQNSGNPKYDPNALPTTEHTGLRAPQGGGEPSTAEYHRRDQREIKIEVMQAKLQDLQMQLKLS